MKTNRPLCAAALSLLLAACGGGGGGGSDGNPPTELPQTLTLSAPATQQGLNTSISFGSNAVDPARALVYAWDFGDGSTSRLAAPSHAYTRPDVYTVSLSVANQAGATLTATGTVKVADLAIVAGTTCTGADHTGYCWLQPKPQGNPIEDYAFADDTHGLAVGDAGTVMATADGGATWNAQNTGTGLALNHVAFVNPMVAWVASEHGQLLKTSDGGASWQAVSIGPDSTVDNLGASDALIAWVTLQANSETYLTVDGGKTWKLIAAPAGLRTVKVISSTDIWALSSYYDDDVAHPLRHSVDAGATWVNVATPKQTKGLQHHLVDLQFIDTRSGLLVLREDGFDPVTDDYVSRQSAWLTADGGATWTALHTGLPANDQSFPIYQYVGADALYSTSYYGSRLRRSVDGGGHWTNVKTPSAFGGGYAPYVAYSAARLMVRGNDGRRYLTTDAGAHWHVVDAGGQSAPDVASVVFLSAREGMVFAGEGTSARTSDGGKTWVKGIPDSYGAWHRAQFIPGTDTGWAIAETGEIYLSNNRGLNWLAPVGQGNQGPGNISDFHFIDAKHGWAVAPYAWDGHGGIYASTDGGVNWTAAPGTSGYANLNSIRFADASHGIAVGPSGIAYVSSDAGATWSPRWTGIEAALRRVTFADSQVAVAIGADGVVARSDDQGLHWTRVASPTTRHLNEITFVSPTTGYIAGDSGTLLATRDAGLTWVQQKTGTRANLLSLYFTDAQTGWVVGSNGSILATVSGGQ